jgi:hypothetical protein
MMKVIDLDTLGIDPNDSWAEVELYRWQHGQLPPNDETCKELNVPNGLRGMAKAIEVGDVKNYPAPFNVISVLRYAAKLLEK